MYSFTSHPKDEAIMVKCLAQGHKCHDRDSNPHSAATELESGKLDRSATTPHIHVHVHTHMYIHVHVHAHVHAHVFSKMFDASIRVGTFVHYTCMYSVHVILYCSVNVC